MRRLRISWLALGLLAGGWLAQACFAQSAEELESPAVNRIATRLNCPCGCKTNMACRMDPYPCRTCWDNKKKILKMEQAGMSDQAILASFASEMGPNTVVVPPGILGSLSFYTAAALGLILVVFVIRKLSRKEAAVARRRSAARSSFRSLSRSNREGSGKARLMVLSAAVVLVMGTLLFTLFVRSQDVPEAPAVSPTAHLEERKAQIYENLRDLQFEFRLGKLSDADYQKTKVDLQRELAKVLAEIDAVQPVAPVRASARQGRRRLVGLRQVPALRR